MKKINYLYIPIGGKGKRLKKDKKTMFYSSKCFLTFQGECLLERIVKKCVNHCEKIVIVYCYREQYDEAYQILADCYKGMPVKYVKSCSSDPYAYMPTDGDCLAIMGDTYVKMGVLEDFFERIEKESILSFFRFYPEKINQDLAYYKRIGDSIYDWSDVEKDGYEYAEIGQILYFPKELVKEAVEQIEKTDALRMLRYFIKNTEKVNAFELECYNINNGKDYDVVSEIICREENNIDFVVMAVFDEVSSRHITCMRDKIRGIAVKELAGEWIPHITLGVYRGDKLQEVLEYTNKFSEGRKSISCFFNSVGQFLHSEKYPKTDVFYLMPACTPELVNLYAEYHEKNDEYLSCLGKDYQYKEGQPTIHCSLSICDVGSFMNVMTFLHRSYVPFCAEIVGIQIADMNKNVISEYKFGEE